MDLVTATRQYISEMIRLAGPGMKIMMMDKETVCLFTPFLLIISCFLVLKNK